MRAAGRQRRTRLRCARRDSVHVLAPVEVQASIAPVAGPTIGSGIPARITTLSGHEIDQWEPRILPDVLGSVAGVSVYDDLGSQYKLNRQLSRLQLRADRWSAAGDHRLSRWRAAERGRRAGGRLRSPPDGARQARRAVERHSVVARSQLARRRDQSRDRSRRGAGARRSGSERRLVRAGRGRRERSRENPRTDGTTISAAATSAKMVGAPEPRDGTSTAS